MIFSSPEVRHSFYQLTTALQVLLHGLWSALAKQGKFIEVQRADSEIIIRITDKAETLISLRGNLIQDEP